MSKRKKPIKQKRSTDVSRQMARVVRSQLKDTISSHGPITPNLIDSATKRIMGVLCVYLGIPNYRKTKDN